MENKLVNGLWVYKPNDKAPDFVKANLSISVDDFIDYLKANQTPKGQIKIDILESRDDKYYAKLNNWTPQEAQSEVRETIQANSLNLQTNTGTTENTVNSEPKVDDIPF